jgi:predicted dinucleotide-binding enzyme
MEIQDAVKESDLVFLATPIRANEGILKGVPFYGKTLVECTKPVGTGITHGQRR